MAHVDNLRRHFPALRHVTYLNTGSYGALPNPTIEAMKSHLERISSEGRTHHTYLQSVAEIQQEVRSQLGQLLKVDAADIALVQSTTQGLNSALWGFPFQPGDELIYTDTEHPGGLLPAYMQKRRRDVVIKCLPLGDGDVLSKLESMWTSRTRVVLASHVSYMSGQKLPIDRMGKWIRERGGYLIVDGAQGAGAEEFHPSANNVDVYIFPGHKWLYGPEGTGAMYVHPRLRTMLDATFVGTAGLAGAHAMHTQGDFLLASTAQRLEFSPGNLTNWVGFAESLKYMRVQCGWDYAWSRIHGLSGFLLDKLYNVPNVSVVTPREHRVGIVAFEVKGISAKHVVEAARERQIDVRLVPERDWVRVSCGFYNTEDDLERLIHCVESL